MTTRCSATPAWAFLVGFIVGWNGQAGVRGGEMLSTRIGVWCDGRARRPVLAVIVVVAAHLARLIPARFDPLRRLGESLTVREVSS